MTVDDFPLDGPPSSEPPASNNDNSRRKSRANKRGHPFSKLKKMGSRVRGFSSRFKNIITFALKSGIVFVLLTLILTIGQYFQSIYSMRINVATLWREGYTADTRNRATKFRLYYPLWEKHDLRSALRSVNILSDQNKVYRGSIIRNDPNLKQLLKADLDEKRRELKRQSKEPKGKENEVELPDNDYVEAALKYRNALIECLNAMETVKAVIEARPWPFTIFSPDSLAERYTDLIEQWTEVLHPFIDFYRLYNKRPTPAWFVLTEGSLKELRIKSIELELFLIQD